jgi:hypothetical protein
MRRLPLLLGMGVAVLAALQACGQNPLLRTASADFSPIRVGSQWSYTVPKSGTAVSRLVSAAGPVQGRDAYTIVNSVTGQPPSTSYWSLQSGALDIYSPTLGWTLQRRLPYVTGNKWDLATGSALVSTVQSVDGIENIATPAGHFSACYRLRTDTSTFDPVADVTTTSETLLWAAPDVGDVRYASVDVSGNVTVTLELSSYRIPQ